MRSISTVNRITLTEEYGRYRQSIGLHSLQIAVDWGWRIKHRDNLWSILLTTPVQTWSGFDALLIISRFWKCTHFVQLWHPVEDICIVRKGSGWHRRKHLNCGAKEHKFQYKNKESNTDNYLHFSTSFTILGIIKNNHLRWLNITIHNQISITSQILFPKVCCAYVRISHQKRANKRRQVEMGRRSSGAACWHVVGTRWRVRTDSNIIRSRVRRINTHLASTGGALQVYSQKQRRRGGTTQQDATQSFCENSSASFKRILNVKFVLIYTLHKIIVCDLLYPIVACRILQGSTDPPCTLDMRIYPSNMMIIPLVLSYPNSIPTITGRFLGVNHRFSSRPSALSHHLWLSTRTIQPPKEIVSRIC